MRHPEQAWPHFPCRVLALLLALLPAPGSALALHLARQVPVDAEPVLVVFADEDAALTVAVASGVAIIALPGAGRIVLGPAPGLPDRLRAAGATSLRRVPAAAFCSVPGGAP